jgi:hypothetical protein
MWLHTLGGTDWNVQCDSLRSLFQVDAGAYLTTGPIFHIYPVANTDVILLMDIFAGSIENY